MKKQMHFVAVCGYANLKEFVFFSENFIIEHWSDLEIEGRRHVSEAWRKISPHPPPDIIRFEPGSVVYLPDEKGNNS